jgi:hypothetical protein
VTDLEPLADLSNELGLALDAGDDERALTESRVDLTELTPDRAVVNETGEIILVETNDQDPNLTRVGRFLGDGNDHNDTSPSTVPTSLNISGSWRRAIMSRGRITSRICG